MDKKDAKALLDTSAEKNRNLLFGFLLYLVTTTLLVLSITDMDLLLIDKAIPLPLLSIDLPITGFYIFLPLLLLVLHFNVLHNSQEHRIKLKQWVAKLAGASPSTEQLAANLFPFIFDIAIVRYDTNLRNRLVAAAVWLLYVYFPPLVLVLFLVRFADLQELSTLYHLVLLGADILLIHLFWNSVVPASIESGLQPIKKQRQLLARTAKTVVTGMLGFYVLMVFILWGALQGLHYGWISHTSLLIKPVAFMAKSENFELVLPRISVPDSYPYKVSEDDVRLSVWADEARYRTKHPQDFNYSADKMAAWTNSAPPLNLSGRHLAFADFSQTLLRRVSLDNAKLQGANLSGAQLEDADLDSAQLQGADLELAWLQEADLCQAQLQGANLSLANLQKADLCQAQLQGANLDTTQLQNANLSSANLQDSHLNTTQLQRADLTEARLQGTDLRTAYLQGANFSGAQLQATNLHEAHLWGANFREAQLQGTDLSSANLQGADLGQAQLQGANLQSAWLKGANIQLARVSGVNWQDSHHEGMYAQHIDTTTKFNFHNISNLNGNAKQRLQEGEKRQLSPPAIPNDLGTTDVEIFARNWLEVLCKGYSKGGSDGESLYVWSDASSGYYNYTTHSSYSTESNYINKIQHKLNKLNKGSVDYGSIYDTANVSLASQLSQWSVGRYTWSDVPSSPYTAITQNKIIDQLRKKECKPYTPAVYQKYPELAKLAQQQRPTSAAAPQRKP